MSSKAISIPQGWITINCVTALINIQRERAILGVNNTYYGAPLYPGTGNLNDAAILRGEILFEMVDKGLTAASSQNPAARSCINDIPIPKEWTLRGLGRRYMMEHMHILGVARETILVDSSNPHTTGSPVGVISGLVDMPNTSSITILAGDRLRARLPTARTQKRIYNHSVFSHSRMVLENSPLRCDDDMDDISEVQRSLSTKPTLDFLASIFHLFGLVGQVSAKAIVEKRKADAKAAFTDMCTKGDNDLFVAAAKGPATDTDIKKLRRHAVACGLATNDTAFVATTGSNMGSGPHIYARLHPELDGYYNNAIIIEYIHSMLNGDKAPNIAQLLEKLLHTAIPEDEIKKSVKDISKLDAPSEKKKILPMLQSLFKSLAHASPVIPDLNPTDPPTQAGWDKFKQGICSDATKNAVLISSIKGRWGIGIAQSAARPGYNTSVLLQPGWASLLSSFA